MSRIIVLPKKIGNKLVALTNKVREESNGVLLYSQQGDRCFVEAYYLVSVGSEGEVQSDPIRSKTVFKFLKENPEYKYIKFHTHTRGTIEQFGEKYARQFSSGDVDGIKEEFKFNPEYIAMLVTPEMILLSGKDNPKLQIVERSEAYEQNHDKIDASLKRIADNLSVEHERLRGTMKIR